MSTLQIFIEYQNGEKKDPLEIDLNETVEFLRYQLFSLTNIPPQAQQIIGLQPGVNLTEHMLLRQLGLTNGQRLIVKTRLTAEVALPFRQPGVASSLPAAPGQHTPTRAFGPLTPPTLRDESDRGDVATTLQACCSRSFFGDIPLIQPSAFVQRDGQEPMEVCMACAQTCHTPQVLKPRLVLKPMRCRCAELGDGKECVYALRSLVAKDLLHGTVAEEAKSALAQVARFTLDAQLQQGKQSMQNRLMNHSRSVMEYEDPSWQRAALEKIPVEELKSKTAKARESGESTLGPLDELMNQLLHWFKHTFFQWVSSPNCDTCGAGTNGIGATAPNAQEAPYRPGVVELYKCAQGHITRFPRYNHALKLLETHRGRCGEWAQAFTLCCRAMGYEARSCQDYTDHIWTEYFSIEQDRWIHADSCEARRDAPMLYEAGWGKKLTYIIASSRDELVDVTQRYTRKFNSEVLDRRTLVPEDWLNTFIQSVNAIKCAQQPQARQTELSRRRVKEQAEFAANLQEERIALASAAAAKVAESKVKEEEKQGRTTGSVEWRAARGELGADDLARQRALAADDGTASSSSSSSSTAAACIPKGKEYCTTDSLPTEKLAGMSLASNSTSAPPPATATATSSSASSTLPADAVAAAKAKTGALFRSYVLQLSKGCGSATCTTRQCKSNPAAVDVPIMGEPEFGKLALELTKGGTAALCPNLSMQGK